MMGGAALTAGAALRVDAHPELGCVTRQRTSDALVHVVTARAAFPACPAVARAVSEVTGQRVGGDTGAGLVAVGSVLRFIRATCAKQLSEGSFKSCTLQRKRRRHKNTNFTLHQGSEFPLLS